ncbi:hypothetical protein [Streptomyces radiopugnans]|uniref:DNA-directed RNA polymerase specialized sigma subunit, sigma24 family n=1 Tax=Streptomyces radiopugnans TaxID=403935 RepID=A0A1H9HUK1_9ACTN|nr:hypothetical protein [Streptomyces radiopugnans]SEQ66033.1 DNA-directed RNA polymerase specialized sigma subunit, sigma24 family [Streptomyces radiopugnans]
MTETLSVPAPAEGAAPETAADERPAAGPPSGLAEAADHPRPATADGPAEAFDLLYERLARPLLRQAYLLTGDRELAGRAVRHAFRQAWERWPEVAVDRDPAGWVRTAAYDHALSPWHRLDPRRRAARRGGTGKDGPGRDGPEGSGGGLPPEALLDLPPSYRRTLLLHDGLGLGLSETAAESEASTAATAARLMHAREALAECVPVLRRVAPARRREIIRSLLEELADTESLPELPSAATARDGSERTVRLRTGASFGATALVAAAALLASLGGPQAHDSARQAPQKTGAPAVSESSPDGPEDRAAG